MPGMIDHINIGKGGKGKPTAAPSTPDQCDNCRFFNFYECRKNPPTVIGVDMPNQDPNDPSQTIYERDHVTEWPKVTYADWCGAHERKKD